MPRVEYTETKGLVQSTGQGFGLNSILTTTQNVQLDGSKSVVIINGAHEVTLPAPADSTDGDVIIILVASNGGGTPKLKADNAVISSPIDLDTLGDYAICVYSSTQWIVGANGPGNL